MPASLLTDLPDRLRARWRSPEAERFAAGWPAGLLLVVLCLAVYLPGLSAIPAVDRDESRFAQASRQMFESVALPEATRDTRPFAVHESRDGTSHVTVGLHSGRLAVPVVGERPRLNKPPLIYWLQATSAAILTQGDPLRDAVWMYRVPSLLAAILAVLATWRLGRSMADPRVGLLAAALLAVCPVVVWESHQARADHALLAATTLTMWGIWELYKRRDIPRTQRTIAHRWGIPLATSTALALGILAKGPITPLVAGLTVLALCLIMRDRRWVGGLRLWLALIVCVALVAPWVWSVAEHVGLERYASIVFDETIGRSAGAKEGHWGPPGYHTVLSAVLFWPGSLLTLGAVVDACRHALTLREPKSQGLKRWLSLPARLRARAPEHDAPLFLLCWLLPTWLVFELVSTKLPHYTLPLYPALALLTALTLHRLIRDGLSTEDARKQRAGIVMWAAIGLAVTAALPALLLLAGQLDSTATTAAWVSLVATTALVLLAATLAFRSNLLAAHAVAVLALATFVTATLGLVLPASQHIWTTRALIATLDLEAPNWRNAPIAAIEYHEDSFMFESRGRLERIGPNQARAWLNNHPDGVLVAPVGIPASIAEPIGPTVFGFNYASGDDVHLQLFRHAETGGAP